MFGFFKSEPYLDSQLGTLIKKSGYWRGSIPLLAGTSVELQLAGSRKAPDADCINLAHQFETHFSQLRKPIEQALFEHYEPYQESASDVELTDLAEPFPAITSAQEVWPHVSPVYVRIEPVNGSTGGTPVIEVAFHVAWDEEHTVAARVQDWHLFELCGSVV
jgi:hypothetical protein